MFKLVVLAALATAAFGMSFEAFTTQYGRTYVFNSTEWHRRSTIFHSNLAKISAHNANPTKSFFMAVNQFADMTSEEMRAFRGYNKAQARSFLGLQQEAAPVFHKTVKDLPSSIDWRTKGAVTPVKNQGGCGSCWAFATTETLESHAALSTNPPTLVELAPQQLVSCCPNPKQCGGTGGCSGATAEVGYDYIVSNGGQTKESLYPYTGRDGKCTYSPTKTPPAAAATGYTKLPENNYTALLNAIATIGPIAISVEADTWSFYGGGIFPASSCNQKNTDIDHAVQLVGYGTDNGKDYWLVRNSWGATWGEKGYIRVERNADGNPCNPDTTPGDGTACPPYPKEVTVCGACGILYDSCYPTGARLL